MNTDIQELWITALTDGSYIQGNGVLTAFDPDTGQRKDCCLGVLCDLAVKAGVLPAPAREYDANETREVLRYADSDGRRYQAYLPWQVVEWAGLEDYAWDSHENADDDDSEDHGMSAGTDIAVSAGRTKAIYRDDASGRLYRDMTLAGRNDAGTTYAGIADIIRTF